MSCAQINELVMFAAHLSIQCQFDVCRAVENSLSRIKVDFYTISTLYYFEYFVVPRVIWIDCNL